jgi:tetratricopeptide (TPR) repeat protein
MFEYPRYGAPHAGQKVNTRMNSPTLTVVPGDVIAEQDKSGVWHAIKIIRVDSFPDGTSTAHCLSYNDALSKPGVSSLAALGVRIWHAPISASSFGRGWERICHQTVSKEELVGFIDYLKLTDFPRYIAFTGQDSKEIVRKANEHYKRAYYLGDEGKLAEAIAEYSRVIDLFPLFYEAVDNRAFTYMELGKYEEALADFELSIRVNPHGFTAFFSKGECLLRLGRLAEAEAIFSEGVKRFPEQRTNFQKYLGKDSLMRRTAHKESEVPERPGTIVVPLAKPFIIWQGQKANVESTDMRIELCDLSSDYAGHQFEELGDQFKAKLMIVLAGKQNSVALEWWERDQLPKVMLNHHSGYSFEVHGCSSPQNERKRWLELAIKRIPSAG